MTLMGYVLAGLAALAALFCWYRWRQALRRGVELAEKLTEAETALQASPVGTIRFSGGTLARPSAALVGALDLAGPDDVTLEDLLPALDADGGPAFAAAAEELCRSGSAFDLRLSRADGARVFDLAGRRLETSHAPVDMVWFCEVTRPVAEMAAAEAVAEKLRAVLDALPIPIWRRDGGFNLVACNEAYAKAVDSSREEAVKDGLELLGKSKAPEARALSQQALDQGESAVESYHVVVEGQRCLLEVRERLLAEGELLGHAIDRTALEEVQSELERHIRVQGEVLENLGTAIAIFGSDLTLTFFNSAYAGLWDIDEDFLADGPHLGDVLEALREKRRLPEYSNFPAFKQETIETYRTMIEPLEELVHLPDGSTLRLLATPHPFGGVLLSYEDVTDRLALETNYNTLIEVQRETLDKLYEGVAVYGADGRLKLWNPAFESIWDLEHSMLAGEPHVREILQTCRAFFGIADSEWADYMEHAVSKTTEADARSGRRERVDGSVIDWARVPLPDGGVLYTFLDVTDSIRVERALLDRNAALETADRLKSEFIANISYELRTPLNAIIGFAEILENQFFGALNERQLEYSQAIVKSSQRLIALINDILDLASIEAGYLELELEPVDVREMLESVHGLGRERAHNQEIELAMDCPEDIGQLMADSRRLRQALFNLLSNALKYTPEGGTVTVSAVRNGQEMALTVADTGIGIVAEDQERVFGKFERGSDQSRHPGVGLGLSLVKSLIELHGGWVELDSGPKDGTSVTCHVPAVPQGEENSRLN